MKAYLSGDESVITVCLHPFEIVDIIKRTFAGDEELVIRGSPRVGP